MPNQKDGPVSFLSIRPLVAALALSAAAIAALPAWATEDPVDPYVQSNANADATPVKDPDLFKEFHGKEGISRIVEDMVDRSSHNPEIAGIFKPFNLERLRRTLKEQLCYILGGPCDYTGRTMQQAHKDMGLQPKDFNALVEDLQWAMRKEGVPFPAQNKLLAKLAPMKRDMMQH